MTGMTPPSRARRVVMLGGGYVSLHAYTVLARRMRRALRAGRLEIIIISADDAHSFHGFTGEVLAGELPLKVTRTPVAQACPLATFMHGRVTEVDVLAQAVRAELVSGEAYEVGYDRLVVGLGSREPVAQVPGLEEHGVTLRRPGDIAALDRRLADLVAAAHPSAAGPRTVVVAGGGLAGAEMAAAVATRGGGALRVVLAQPHEEPLPQLEPFSGLRGSAVDALERCGVEVRRGVRVTAVGAGHAMLSNGERVETATVLGAIGQRPVPVRGLEGLPHDAQGRLITTPELRVASRIWAAGDAARVRHPATGLPVPANALWAIKAGDHLGANLARSLRGGHTRSFGYRGLGQAACFGRGRAIAELYGLPLTGWLAWLLRLGFFVRFMPSRRRAIQALRYAVWPVRRAGRPQPGPEPQPCWDGGNLRLDNAVSRSKT